MRRFYVVKKSTFYISVLVIMAIVFTSITYASNAIYTSAVERSEGIPVPIIMYHSVLKNKKSTGKYVVTPETVEADFAYLKNRGYTAVFVQDIVNYVKHDGKLPEKPVVITFDDGYLNNLSYVLPLLEKYDMKATISIVGKYSENFSNSPDPNPNYAHLTWEDIKTLVNSGRVEIANHTYDMHKQQGRKGCMQKNGETVCEYAEILADDITANQQLLADNCSITPNIFTYPYGAVSESSYEVIRNIGFEASLGCLEKLNYITKDVSVLRCLHRFNRPSGISTEKFMKKLQIE